MGEMEKLADLGTALYPMEGPSGQMRAKALSTAIHPARHPARPSWVRPLLATGAAAVLVATAVAVGTVATTGGGATGSGGGGPTAISTTGLQPAAFTVRMNDDGSVTFTARDLVDAGAATRALNQAGIAGRVIDVSDDTKTCGLFDPHVLDDLLDSARPGDKAVVGWRGGRSSITVRSSDYRPGGGLLVAVVPTAKKANGQVTVAVLVRPVTDARKIPAC